MSAMVADAGSGDVSVFTMSVLRKVTNNRFIDDICENLIRMEAGINLPWKITALLQSFTTCKRLNIIWNGHIFW